MECVRPKSIYQITVHFYCIVRRIRTRLFHYFKHNWLKFSVCILLFVCVRACYTAFSGLQWHVTEGRSVTIVGVSSVIRVTCPCVVLTPTAIHWRLTFWRLFQKKSRNVKTQTYINFKWGFQATREIENRKAINK